MIQNYVRGLCLDRDMKQRNNFLVTYVPYENLCYF